MKKATFSFEDSSDYAIQLSKLATDAEEIAGKAIYAGAKIAADQIRKNINKLPNDAFRFLFGTDKFSGTPEGQKRDLLEALGVTELEMSKDGFWNVKIGFDGYGSYPTRLYPKGIPNQMLMRSIESGSSVRRKNAVIRRSMNSINKKIEAKLAEVVEEEIMKIMQGEEK